MAQKSGRKTFSDSSGKRRHTTKWQKLVSKHGIKGAKKHYANYYQRPVPPTTTGSVSSTKSGPRRTKGNKIGGGKRSNLFFKGDKVGTWTKSRGNTKKGGDAGKGWFMDRGYGTARKPVPDTKLTQRLGIAGKTDLLTGHPSAVYEDWEEADKVAGKSVKDAEFDAEMTMWQGLVKKHGMKGAKKHYANYRQRPPPSNTTGHVRMTKSGPRRVKDNKVGRGKRSIIYYKGDRVGTWTKSGGISRKGGNTGLAWFMERGYGTVRNPVPDTPLTRRLGIANKGRRLRDIMGRFGKGKNTMLTGHPNALYEGWEESYWDSRIKGIPVIGKLVDGGKKKNLINSEKGVLAERSITAREKLGHPTHRRLSFSEIWSDESKGSLGKFAFGKAAESSVCPCGCAMKGCVCSSSCKGQCLGAESFEANVEEHSCSECGEEGSEGVCGCYLDNMHGIYMVSIRANNCPFCKTKGFELGTPCNSCGANFRKTKDSEGNMRWKEDAQTMLEMAYDAESFGTKPFDDLDYESEQWS